MTRRDPPPLSAIHTEITGTPAPLPWWIRNHDLLACVACICIAVAWAVGEWRLG